MKTTTRCVIAFVGFIVQGSMVCAQWEQTRGPYGGRIQAMAELRSTLYASDWEYGVYRSVDAGASWTHVAIPSDFEVSTLASNGTYVFAGGSNQITLRSSDGESWTEIGSAPLSLIASTSLGLFAAQGGAVVVRSTDDGTTWTVPNPTFLPGPITSITEMGTSLIVGTERGAWRSTDNGTSWSDITSALSDQYLWSVAVLNGNIYVATPNAGVYKSTNIGATWTQVNNGITNVWTSYLAAHGSTLLVGSSSGIFRSTDEGVSWAETKVSGARAGLISSVLVNTHIYAGTGNGVYVSSDAGETWNAASAGLPPAGIGTMHTTDTDFFVGTTTGGIYRCDANGVDWIAANDPAMYPHISAITSRGTDLFAAANDAFFRSTDAGQTWTMVCEGLTAEHYDRIRIYTLASRGQTLFAGTGSHGVYRSTDDGVSWQRTAPTTTELHGLVVMGRFIFTGGLAGVYRSSNDGASWSRLSLDQAVQSMAVSGSRLLVGTWDGLPTSSDSGTTFIPSTGLGERGTAFAIRGSIVVAGLNGDGNGGNVMLSTNFGKSWASIKANLPTSRVEAVALSKTHIYVGGESPEAGVWRRPLTDLISDVHESLELPINVPSLRILTSPRTNSATIAFTLERATHVTLNVYNVQGERVSTLLSEHREAGACSFELDARGLTGVMYYVHLQCSTLSETAALPLMR